MPLAGEASDDLANLDDEVVMTYSGISLITTPHGIFLSVTMLLCSSRDIFEFVSVLLSLTKTHRRHQADLKMTRKLELHGICACPLLWQTDMQLFALFIASSSFQFSDLSLSCHPGHRNSQTVKGVSFLGEDDKFVMSGSDDGHIYIWSSNDGILRQWLKGDKHVVNCLEPHPCQPLSFATSGAPSC